MSKYNSVIDAIHASMDAFIEEGLLDASAKKMDVAGALHALNQALLNQEDASVSEDIAATNAQLRLQSRISWAFCWTSRSTIP